MRNRNNHRGGKRARFALALFAMLSISSTSHALAIVNGSFETGPAVGDWVTLEGGSTDLTGWAVLGAGVDLIGSQWVASDGGRSLDLNALAGGGVSQVLDTVVGQTYSVLFDLSRNYGGPSGDYDVQVSAGGTSEVFDYSGTPSSGDMQWLEREFQFTATSTSTTLLFESLVGSDAGPALDNVRVIATPEPSTAMLVMIALSGLATLRRSHA